MAVDPDVLSPAVAADLFAKDPSQIVFRLGDLPDALGLSRDELLEELRSGRLIGSGQRTADGYERLGVCGDHLLNWLGSNAANARKARAALGSRYSH